MMGAGQMVSEEEHDAARKRISELEERVTELQERMTSLVLEHQQKQRYGSRANRQRMVFNWAIRMFGPSTRKIHERALRVVEEAIELAQAAGVSETTISNLLNRVYWKPPGPIHEEIGGTMVALLALVESSGLDADTVERDEIERIMSKDQCLVRASQVIKSQLGLGEPLPEEFTRIVP